MKNDSIKEAAAIAFLFVLAALYFLPVLAKGNNQVLSSAGTDTWSQFFYWRHFGFAMLARGEFPLWNPYAFSGTPFMAGMQSAIFYPFNILYLLFATPLATNLSVAVHCFLAGVFTYLYSRFIEIDRAGSLLSALTFVYGAPYFFHIYPGHLSILLAVAWLPLMFMGLEAFLRKKDLKYVVLGGVPLAMQILAGHPQYLVYSVIAVFLYFLAHLLARKERKSVLYFLWGFCVFVVTGISLSAIQLLPSLELTRQSARAALTYEWISTFSLPPEKLATLLLPDFFGNMVDVPYWGKNYLWEMSIYIGAIPLALVVVGVVLDHGRQVRAFSFIAIVALVLAFGKHTPLLAFLYHYVPGFDLFRGLSKFIFIFAFAGAVIAGCGLKKLETLAENGDPRLRYVSYTLLAASFLLVSLGTLVWLSGQDFWKSLVETYAGENRYSRLPPLTGDFLNAARRLAFQGFLKTSIALMLLGALLFLFSRFDKRSARLMTVSILALAAIDLWSFGSRYLVTFDPKLSHMDRELKAFLKGDNEPFRVATPLLPLLNMGMLEGIENVGGYDAFVLRRYSELINLTQGLPIDQPNLAMRIRRASPLLDLFNVKYYIVESAAGISDPTFDLVFQNPRYKVYRRKSALPRSFVVHDAWVIKGRDAIFRKMASPEFDPASFAVVEETIEGLSYERPWQSPAPRILRYSPNKVSIEADIEAPGLLVLADTYYPGWKAFVDGKESRIYRANYVMRAVFLPTGRHTVEFRYDPLSFKIGAAISLVSLLIVVCLVIFMPLRHGIERSEG